LARELHLGGKIFKGMTPMKKPALFLLALAISQPALAASQTIAAQKLECGGYVSVYGDGTGRFALAVQKSRRSECQHLTVESLAVDQELAQASTIINLDPQAVGEVLPVLVDEEAIVLTVGDLKARVAAIDAERSAAQARAQAAAQAKSQRVKSGVGLGLAIGILGAAAAAGAAANAINQH
jgi:hypothetical protein